MGHPYWPLFDVVIRTPRLEVRYPDDSLLIELATLAAQGVHDPDEMPFTAPWTRAKSPQLEKVRVQAFVGSSGIMDTRRLALCRSGGRRWTSRWPPRFVRQVIRRHQDGHDRILVNVCAHQGDGIGKEMRAAVLHLAFAGLGAQLAYSGSFEDNAASFGVSRSLGYVENGDEIKDREGKSARLIGFKLTRDVWEQSRRGDIEIVRLERCLDWFGAGDTSIQTP